MAGELNVRVRVHLDLDRLARAEDGGQPAALACLEVRRQQPTDAHLGEELGKVGPRHPKDAGILALDTELLLAVVGPLARGA